MKNIFLAGIMLLVCYPGTGICQQTPGYILEVEKDIEQVDSLHFGGGLAIGYSFFSEVKDFDFVFRKRVLTPGAAIQYHLQKEDEIYYILSGRGEMRMNDEVFEVSSGSAVLTRAGSSHGLRPLGDEELVLIIVYMQD